jgi:hypothetical protein
MSALGQKRSFALGQRNVRFTPVVSTGGRNTLS